MIFRAAFFRLPLPLFCLRFAPAKRAPFKPGCKRYHGNEVWWQDKNLRTMIDTHTHLYAEEFDEDRNEAIQRALEKGITEFYLPAIDSESHEKMLQLEAEYPNQIFSMMGLHPCYVKPESWEHELKIVKEYLDKRAFPAIGEIGIDLYWDKTTLDIQVKAFEQQIDWAIEKDLPIVIHTRESFDETFEVLERKKHPKLRGIFHCFSGNLEQAKHSIDLNFILGIGGVVTFKNGKIDQFLNEIPLDKIVLETGFTLPCTRSAQRKKKRKFLS